MNFKLKKAARYNIWDYFAAMVTATCVLAIVYDILIVIGKLVLRHQH